VIGAGTMGTGVANVFTTAGCADVRLMARHQHTLEKAGRRIARSPQILGFGEDDRERSGAADRPVICLTISFDEALWGCELVIESISKDLDAKLDVLRRAEAAASGSAILTSNISSVRIEEEPRLRGDAAWQVRRYYWCQPA